MFVYAFIWLFDVHDVNNGRYFFQEDLLQAAIDSLVRKVTPFEELEKQVSARNTVKVDFDSYIRKVQAIRDKPPPRDLEKLAKTETKLLKAGQELFDITQDIYRVRHRLSIFLCLSFCVCLRFLAIMMNSLAF